MIDDPTAVTTVRRDWDADEAAAGGLWRELGRLGRRARRRWPTTLAAALACSALVVTAAALLPARYVARVVFAVTPAGDDGLADYVGGVVLARAQLARVVADRALYPSLAPRDPERAIERLRQSIDVAVAPGDDGGRSSRLAIRVTSDDAEQAYETARQLGRMLAAAPPSGRRLWLLQPAEPQHAGGSAAARLLWLALCALALALPLCAIAVGAFDPRVYDLDDVRRLGMPVAGAVRPFDGDNAGALVERLRDGRRGRIARS